MSPVAGFPSAELAVSALAERRCFYVGKFKEVYDVLAEFTVDVSNDVVGMLQDYMNDPDRIEELFDRCSVPAAKAMGQLNEIISVYVPEGA